VTGLARTVVHRASGSPLEWYVNFERPFRRTRSEVRIGLIDALHARIDAAREQVVALVEAREGPFADDWSTWRPEPDWPLPTLPPDALSPLRP
jgi:hypothetical protein